MAKEFKNNIMGMILGVGALMAIAYTLALSSQVLKGATSDMIYAALGLIAMAGALYVIAMALNLMKDVGEAEITAMGVAILGMVLVLMAMSGLQAILWPAIFVLIAFGAAMIAIGYAIQLAAEGMVLLAEIDVMSIGLGMLAFGAGMLLAGLGIMAGLSMIVLAMMMGPLLMGLAIVFMIATAFIMWGLANIIEGVGGDVKNLEVMGTSMYAALGGLAAGILMLVATPYWKFWGASKDIAAGMWSLMDVAWWADKLDFARSTRKMAKGLQNLSTAIKSFGSSSGFKASAKAFRNAIWTIGDGIWYYADYVEQAAFRVVDAVTQVSASAGMLKMFGLDEAIKTSAAVTVKADLEDKNKETADREGQLELLEGIKSALTGIHSSMSKLAGGSDTTEQLNKISDIVTQYLPEIAESGGGLVDATNQWNSSMG